MKFKKGQHVVCKYQGEGGDLIVGVVDSVRTNGDVILVNLLTGAKATKRASVLAKRNKVVPKAVALQVLRSSKDKSVIRQNAIAAAKAAEVAPGQLKLPLDAALEAPIRDYVQEQIEQTVGRAVEAYLTCNDAMRREVLKRILAIALP